MPSPQARPPALLPLATNPVTDAEWPRATGPTPYALVGSTPPAMTRKSATASCAEAGDAAQQMAALTAWRICSINGC